MGKAVKEFRDIAFIGAGMLSASFGVNGFLLSSRFIDGGVTGISMLTSMVFDCPIWILILAFNIPFIMLAYRQVGTVFAVKSALAIAGLAICLAVIPWPDVTPDNLLTAVFGGFFLGAGIGLAIRGGAVLDGTEIVALLVSKKSHILKVGDVILAMNIVIFSSAAFLLSVESALYSMITYFAASRTVDFLLHGIEEYTAIMIISERSDEIKQAIISGLNRGVTVFMGRGGMSDREQDILLCVVTRLEIGGVRTIASGIDPAAFIIIHPLSAAEGGVIKKSVLPGDHVG
jgi:uncharacterized membrane-anchored protein YitT (DUF2179 family)